MKIQQLVYNGSEWDKLPTEPSNEPCLIICFGQKALLIEADWYNSLRDIFKNGTIVSASTAGEITNDDVRDDCIVASCVTFEEAHFSTASVNIKDFENSFSAGKSIADNLDQRGLKLVLILSDGSEVNGGDLISGINEKLDNQIPVAGGLAGDGPHFRSTVVGLNDNIAHGNIVVVSFYGELLNIGFGFDGGWSAFGPTRNITKSEKNVVYEIDNENALDLYKKYLGEYADQLPGSALLFPLSLIDAEQKMVVRTILSIDQEKKSMTFAANMPEGGKVRLMKTTIDKLVDAASSAADQSTGTTLHENNCLALLISCVGRKLVFDNRVDEELEAVRYSLGDNATIAGFYSYGEIAPGNNFTPCQLHNQTMTITTISEGSVNS